MCVPVSAESLNTFLCASPSESGLSVFHEKTICLFLIHLTFNLLKRFGPELFESQKALWVYFTRLLKVYFL